MYRKIAVSRDKEDEMERESDDIPTYCNISLGASVCIPIVVVCTTGAGLAAFLPFFLGASFSSSSSSGSSVIGAKFFGAFDDLPDFLPPLPVESDLRFLPFFLLAAEK